MSEKKNTCPVCFTKMRSQNNVLVCPECGYKLCDHSYTYHNSYSTEHTHTPNYTTSYRTGSSANYTQQPDRIPAQTSRPNSGAAGTSGNNKTTKRAKIVTCIVAIFVIIRVLSVFRSLFASLPF